jgi:8-oxo-dGTP pyrophosphatase MutT (NUDIX family)
VSDASSLLPSSLPIRKHGVVAVVLDGDRFLVIRRSQHVRAPGMYCFPGGAIEPGESEAEAVVREMREELTATVRPLRRLCESVTPWQVHLAWWLVELAPETPLVPQPAEVESIHWLTAAEIRSMADVLTSNLEFLRQWELILARGSAAEFTALADETAG